MTHKKMTFQINRLEGHFFVRCAGWTAATALDFTRKRLIGLGQSWLHDNGYNVHQAWLCPNAWR